MQEKGFILGATEDGILYYRENKNEYGLEIEQKVMEWLLVVQEALKIAYNKQSRIRKMKKGYYRLNVYSKSLYHELVGLRNNPQRILEQPEAFQTGFLQGIFDAEGSVRLDRNHISVSSNRESLISLVTFLLVKRDIIAGKPWQDSAGVISLSIYGIDDIKKFSDLVGFRHPEKKHRLQLLVNGV
ncbi:MAG: hypothetical protein HYY37_06855 [Candidatus Aenigmarchaeota archaeon]|nr:hypothetical protein [Candidatus Aenigmarchaeota archaeon]